MTDEAADRPSFSLDSRFAAAQPSGGLELGPMEIQYQALFSEALEDGVITADERQRLNQAASNLGLNSQRLERLEQAMTAAYESHFRVPVRDQSRGPQLREDQGPGAGEAEVAAELAGGSELALLKRENAQLKVRVAALEQELERAHAAVAIEVDLSSFATSSSEMDDPLEIWRRVSHDPTDVHALRALRAAHLRRGDLDGAQAALQAVVALGEASSEEAQEYADKRRLQLIAPQAPISEELWGRGLFHPEQEPLTGAIFSVVTPAVLMGRVTALQRAGELSQFDASKKQQLETTTVMSVRAVGWAAALLGLPTPTVYADPALDTGYTHALGMPPYSVVGKRALSGRDMLQLAFLVGQHLAQYRGEHFVTTLFGSSEDLEDLFLAALFIANPQLALPSSKQSRIAPLAQAIQPLLPADHIDALRGHYFRFADHGGRANLGRWSTGAKKTAARAGLALCQDLPSAFQMVQEQEGRRGPLALDLLVHFTSPRFLELRRHLGVLVEQE